MRICIAHVLDYCTAGSGPVFESDVSHSEKIFCKKRQNQQQPKTKSETTTVIEKL